MQATSRAKHLLSPASTSLARPQLPSGQAAGWGSSYDRSRNSPTDNYVNVADKQRSRKQCDSPASGMLHLCISIGRERMKRVILGSLLAAANGVGGPAIADDDP